jgi:hypothetical protein
VGARSLWRAYRDILKVRLLEVLQYRGHFLIALLLDKSVLNYPYHSEQGAVLDVSQASLPS